MPPLHARAFHMCITFLNTLCLMRMMLLVLRRALESFISGRMLRTVCFEESMVKIFLGVMWRDPSSVIRSAPQRQKRYRTSFSIATFASTCNALMTSGPLRRTTTPPWRFTKILRHTLIRRCSVSCMRGRTSAAPLRSI